MRTYEQFKWLQALYESGLLTEAELEGAKASVLAGTMPEARLIELGMRRFEPQGVVLRLDQEWEEERKSYLRRAKSGSCRLPDTTRIFVTGIVVNCLFISLILIGGRTSYETLLTAVGILGVILEPCVTGVRISRARVKAEAYNKAYEAYQRKRAVLKSAEPGRQSGYISLT